MADASLSVNRRLAWLMLKFRVPIGSSPRRADTESWSANRLVAEVADAESWSPNRDMAKVDVT